MTFQPTDIAPYIGLRAFAEDDSIYFKGREEHILQITALLELNKFLMVTGASGDGKSSLVYAGLIPNARAGFFKAQYPNWAVADFRPERTPLKNLCRSISRNLRIGNEESVELELRRGFSSLVGLYKQSSLWVDVQTIEWSEASEDGRDALQRTAANLLIITDQFEEFFTNPENYYRNQPSADSQLVINLLLETARIAIEQNLPIYIVCTMRSDYIGQCASFRGLPEFIGFSQFFVPRLKRKEIIEVVREPALLHGDKISNRLVERVVYDLGEGIDQLPVLQHAMNEVWVQAKNGEEEMDLLHYAMAGGMAAKDLPAEDRKRFDSWFASLSSTVQSAYHLPGLSRIIDTHANKLYLSAAQHYNRDHTEKISDDDAQLIIRITFISLTKMDDGRAVRNRMTLGEITNIIDRPHLNVQVVGDVLNVFREPGNTFLRPYISDDPESHTLKENSVLDITHESLIRNWELLLRWANEEFESLVIYKDFKKQLDRWIASGKSRGFLLSIGPLTWFESWYDKLRPNAWWVNRYLDPGISANARTTEANQSIADSREFLKRSAARHVVTRALVRHGAGRITVVAASILVAASCVYFFLDSRKRQNSVVLNEIMAEAKPLLKDGRVVSANKAVFLIASGTIDPGSFKKTLATLPVDYQVVVCGDIYTEFAWNSLKEDIPMRTTVLLYIDSLLNKTKQISDPVQRLKFQNLQAVRISHHLYFLKNPALQQALQRSLSDIKSLVMGALITNENSTPNMNFIDDGLENLLNNKTLSTDDIQKLLASFSPFESESAKQHFEKICPVPKSVNYNRGMQVSHNNGYQELAYLYAVLGKTDIIKHCIDSLVKYNRNYVRYVNNPTMIAAYLLREHHDAGVEDIMHHFAAKRNMPVSEGYEQWISNSGIFDMDFSNKLWLGENHNIVLNLESEALVRKTFDLFEKQIRIDNQDPDALHYNLALYYKQRGTILTKMRDEGRATLESNEIRNLFDLALHEYQNVSIEYRNESVPIYVFGKIRVNLPRKNVFTFPDYLQRIWNRSFTVQEYYSPAFFNYLLDSKHFTELYPDLVKAQGIRIWLEHYWLENMTSTTTQVEKNYTPIPVHTLERIDSLYSMYSREQLNGLANTPRLLLIHEYLMLKDFDKVEPLYARLDIEKLSKTLRGDVNTTGLQYPINSLSPIMNELAAFLISKNRRADADKIMAQYTNRNNLIIAYADAARRLPAFSPSDVSAAFPYFDSAVSVSNNLNKFDFSAADPRIIVAYAMSAAGDRKWLDISEEFVKQVSINAQTDVVESWIHGIASSGKYYTAYSNIPEIAILSDRLTLYNLILMQEAIKVADPKMKAYLSMRKELFYQEDYGFDTKIN